MSRVYPALKRTLDVVGAGLALVLLAPLAIAVAVVVALMLGRPVLFRQTRPGRHGRPFHVVKFRTMRLIDPLVSTSTMVALDAARLTMVGRWLRALSLDEIPTLWNVLRGDMSLVGPRPLLMEYLPRYTPEQARRHDVRPGITGLAQVRGRNALAWEEKFAYDVYYVDHRGLGLDLRILGATVWVVVRRRGITAAGSATAPEFVPTQPLAPSVPASSAVPASSQVRVSSAVREMA